MACCPICQTRDLCQGTQYCRGMEMAGKSHCPNSHHGSTCYAVEDTGPHHTWELSPGIRNRTSHPDQRLCTPGWKETMQSPQGSHCPAASWTCWNTLYLEWNTHHWKRGEGGGPGLVYLTPSPSPHAWDCCLPSQHVWCAQPGQFPKAPSLEGQGGMFCFPLVQSFGPRLFPLLAWRTL